MSTLTIFRGLRSQRLPGARVCASSSAHLHHSRPRAEQLEPHPSPSYSPASSSANGFTVDQSLGSEVYNGGEKGRASGYYYLTLFLFYGALAWEVRPLVSPGSLLRFQLS